MPPKKSVVPAMPPPVPKSFVKSGEKVRVVLVGLGRMGDMRLEEM